MDMNHFSKIFIRGLFKESILDVLRDIELGVQAVKAEAMDSSLKAPIDENLSLEMSKY